MPNLRHHHYTSCNHYHAFGIPAAQCNVSVLEHRQVKQQRLSKVRQFCNVIDVIIIMRNALTHFLTSLTSL